MEQKQKYIEGFRRWLSLHNFDESSQKRDPKVLLDFLIFMGQKEVEKIDQITGQKVKEYFAKVAQRKSKTRGQILSLSTQRNYLTIIKRFRRYLHQSEQGHFEIPIQFKGKETKTIKVFSKAEIEKLYDVTDDSLLGMRDRAMLGIYYGCGLRRNEGVELEIRDFIFEKSLIFVRNGKGYKQRFVPMIGRVKKDIISYLKIARPQLQNKNITPCFFVGITGRKIKSTSLYESLRNLQEKAKIEDKSGLHLLRHSIATHLLIEGMGLSQIAKFMGHSSLESTQIYTHIKDGLPI